MLWWTCSPGKQRKEKIWMFALGTALLIPIYAQEIPDVEVDTENGLYPVLDYGPQPGWKIEASGVSDKVLDKTLKQWLKDFHGKISTQKKTYVLDDVIISSISDHPLDVYVRVEGTGKDQATAYIFFHLGGAFLNSRDHPDAWKRVDRMIQELARKIRYDALQSILDEQQDILKDLERELTRLENQQHRLQKEIEDCQNTIQENQKALEENQKQQEDLKKQIARQQTIVEQLEKKLSEKP